MCCGNGSGGGSRTNTQQRRRLNTTTTLARSSTATWRVTLPDGSVQGGLTEHQALVLTLERGGGMEPEMGT